MATTPVTTTKIYKPAMLVGQVYARAYGATTPHIPIGNVLKLELEHSEDVITQEDMTKLGGGTYAEVRRVKEVAIKMELADNFGQHTTLTFSALQKNPKLAAGRFSFTPPKGVDVLTD